MDDSLTLGRATCDELPSGIWKERADAVIGLKRTVERSVPLPMEMHRRMCQLCLCLDPRDSTSNIRDTGPLVQTSPRLIVKNPGPV